MFGFLRQMEYAEWADEEYRKRESALTQGLTECVRCGACCARRTCAPTPDEIPIIAEHLGITVENLVKEYLVGDSSKTAGFHLKFANTKQHDITGTYIDSDRTFDMGDCILYDKENKSCKIHSVKPKEAVNEYCLIENDDPELASQSWKEGDMERFGVKL